MPEKERPQLLGPARLTTQALRVGVDGKERRIREQKRRGRGGESAASGKGTEKGEKGLVERPPPGRLLSEDQQEAALPLAKRSSSTQTCSCSRPPGPALGQPHAQPDALARDGSRTGPPRAEAQRLLQLPGAPSLESLGRRWGGGRDWAGGGGDGNGGGRGGAELNCGNWKPVPTASLRAIFTVLGCPGAFRRPSRLLEESLAGCQVGATQPCPDGAWARDPGQGGECRGRAPGRGIDRGITAKIKCERGGRLRRREKRAVCCCSA